MLLRHSFSSSLCCIRFAEAAAKGRMRAFFASPLLRFHHIGFFALQKQLM
jgi:hypothetical protein